MNNSIRNIMATVNGNSFVGMDTKTVPVLAGGKKNPQQGRIQKVMAGASVMVFQNKNVNGYEAMVSRRLTKEGKNPASFKLGARAWGTRVPNLPIVEHKDKTYLEVIFLKGGKVSYLLDGQPIAKSDIIGLKDKEEGAQGGLNDKVIIRSFNIDNVTALRIDRKEYTNITA